MPPEHRAWMDEAVAKLREQRQALGAETVREAVEIQLQFLWPVPKARPSWCSLDAWRERGAYGIARTTKPDGDNCEKAILDALVAAGILQDDALVVRASWTKMHAQEGPLIEVYVDPF
jgi:Holliday junction resolvase RusA-like endonuclease